MAILVGRAVSVHGRLERNVFYRLGKEGPFRRIGTLYYSRRENRWMILKWERREHLWAMTFVCVCGRFEYYPFG